jgi:hypothetical protein
LTVIWPKQLGAYFSVAGVQVDSTNTRPLIAHPMHQVDGEDFEVLESVGEHGKSKVLVVRDVTERYRRFEAERRAHAGVLGPSAGRPRD